MQSVAFKRVLLPDVDRDVDIINSVDNFLIRYMLQ